MPKRRWRPTGLYAVYVAELHRLQRVMTEEMRCGAKHADAFARFETARQAASDEMRRAQAEANTKSGLPEKPVAK